MPQAATPRAHLRAVVRTVETHPDPGAALRALRTALRGLAPGDGALPWLEVAVLGLTGAAPLPGAACLRLVAVLRDLADPPVPAQLARHLPHGAPGTALLGGGQALPDVVLRLCDRRGAPDPAPLLRFLAALAADRELPAYHRLAPLRALVAELGTDAAAPPGAGRVIVQIRVDAVDPEHVADRRYELRGAYYRQPADGGPLRWLGALPPSEPFRRGELTGEGSARMAAWAEPAREIRSGGGVRIEFLLPQDLLGHRADLWSAGPSRTPLGAPTPGRGALVGALHRVLAGPRALAAAVEQPGGGGRAGRRVRRERGVRRRHGSWGERRGAGGSSAGFVPDGGAGAGARRRPG